MRYCAIIGDIVGSKRIAPETRFALQETLKAELEALNAAYKDVIAARFLITLGDEFQGLLTAAWPTVPIIRRLIRVLWPVHVRFGIGWGEIYTQIDPTQAIGADGEAFYRAREAITRSKQRGWEHFPVTYSTGEEDEQLLDGFCGLMEALTSGWSDKQRKAVWTMEINGGTQKAAAEALDRAPSSMSTLLHNAKYREYNDAMEKLETYLRWQYDEQGGKTI